MNKINLIALCLTFVFCSALTLWAGPKEMTESQMTDITVDDTVVSPGQADSEDEANEAKSSIADKSSQISLLKNPVDDPTLLNQAEIMRLEKQAADQRVNDQIQNSLQNLPNQ